MNYKIGFYFLAVFTFLIMFPSLYFIHKSLDKVHEQVHIMDQRVDAERIKSYQDIGWLPHEIKITIPVKITLKAIKRKPLKEKVKCKNPK